MSIDFERSDVLLLTASNVRSIDPFRNIAPMASAFVQLRSSWSKTYDSSICSPFDYFDITRATGMTSIQMTDLREDALAAFYANNLAVDERDNKI
jgi:hypothetical protein